MKKINLILGLLLVSQASYAQWSIANPTVQNGKAEIHSHNGQLRLFETDFGNPSVDYTQLERNSGSFHLHQHSSTGFQHVFTGTVTGRVGIGGITSPQSALHVKMGHQESMILQSSNANTYTGISFRHNTGVENWRLRSFSNYPGGYGNLLALEGSGDFWISAGKTLIGSAGSGFDFTNCNDCNDYNLFVKKGIRTEQVKVDIASGVWADYVFESDYNLKTLAEVESYIEMNKHLPGIPAADEIEKEGLNLAEMDAKLLEKIEELTLYIIDQQKQSDSLKDDLKKMREDYELLINTLNK